jgi:hypothetical protein
VENSITALCVFRENTEDGELIVADSGKYSSSWFEIVRVSHRELANKGYTINTFSKGKSLDIEGGNTKNGSKVVQYQTHNDSNQVWMIVPAD